MGVIVLEIQNPKSYNFMSSKLGGIIFVFILSLTLPTAIPFILKYDFSIFMKSILIIQELIFDLLLSGLLVLYTNDFAVRMHLGCKAINSSKSLNNIMTPILVIYIVIKNIPIGFSHSNITIMPFYSFCSLFCLILGFSMINRVYLSDKIIHLGKYQKSINLDEIKSITLTDKNIEMITSSDRYVFVGTGEMMKEIEAQIR